MKPAALPCAIYTRKSSEEGLEQDFNSLDAQREACAAYILSQKALGWKAASGAYEDGGFSGGNTERPALQRLLTDIALSKVKVVVVYKVDRLTRSLADFAKMVELFDAQGVSFVSVTQQFNTTTSMGRLTLNVLLSFAQFEREVTGERIRDKIAASKQKGLWMGGIPPVGYRPDGRSLVPVPEQAERIVHIFELYLQLGCVSRLKMELDRRGWRTPARNSKRAHQGGNRPFSRGHLYRILSNQIYIGRITHKGSSYKGNHAAIVPQALWEQVQTQLQANRKGHKTRTQAKVPSLLVSLVVDANGHRLIASHANKAGKRYRYYIHPEEVKAQAPGQPLLRVPAQDLEDLVLQKLKDWLEDERQVVDAVQDAPGDRCDAASIQQALSTARSWAGQLQTLARTGEAAGDQTLMAIVQALVKQVVIAPQEVRLKLYPQAVRSDPSADSACVELAIPAQLRRCGMAMRFVLQASTDAPPQRAGRHQVDAHLVALLRKANTWAQKCLAGRPATDPHVSIAQLAQAEGVTPSYLLRVLYLAFLDPWIVRQIVQGAHPPALTAKGLLSLGAPPVLWSVQRQALGWEGNQ